MDLTHQFPAIYVSTPLVMYLGNHSLFQLAFFTGYALKFSLLHLSLIGLLLLLMTQVVSSSLSSLPTTTTSACGSLQFGLFLTCCVCVGLFAWVYLGTYVRSTMFGLGAHACAPISHLQRHLTVIIIKFIYDFGFFSFSLFLSITPPLVFSFYFIIICCLVFCCCLFCCCCCCCCVTLEIYFVPRLNVSFVQFTLHTPSSLGLSFAEEFHVEYGLRNALTAC